MPDRGIRMVRKVLLAFLVLAMLGGLAGLLLARSRPTTVLSTTEPPDEGPVSAITAQCPDQLTARKPPPPSGTEPPPTVRAAYLPEGFTRVEDFVEDKSFAGLWSPSLPDDLEQALVPPVEVVQLYAPGQWADADRYVTVVALPVSRELGCFMVRMAAGEDRARRHGDGERPDTDPSAWHPPPTQNPADPRAHAVALRGTTGILTPAEAPAYLGRLLWMEDDDLLVQVLAEQVPDNEVLQVAEGLTVTEP